MVEILLKDAHNLIKKGLNASNDKISKERYLKASKKLLKASKESNGQIKETRLKNAKKLIQKAEALSTDSESRKKQDKNKEDKSKGEKNKQKAEENDLEEEVVLKEELGITFDKIGGLSDVKEEIKSKILYPYLYPEKAEKYGIHGGGGLLLYGPPGTGKTMLAKATATEIDAEFYSIDPDNIMSRWVGNSEEKVTELFKNARQHDRAVIFIDEVDSLLPKRRSTNSSVMKRVVPKLLGEMEGIENEKDDLLFLGATNEPWSIDQAALRPGRFDKKILVPPPDLESRRKIFKLNLDVEAITEDIDYKKIAEITEGYSGADIEHICYEAKKRTWLKSIKKDEEAKIDTNTILEIIKKTSSSISDSELKKYREFEK
ncbi:MAG: ATPase of the AAA+ class CDC48 family [Candidatus Methanohalarchaeum thermophilum]|uniref:ATPase of the AAA+ class CDC48 family n=1 Tax=Methanohalarchaeum thermophilum TaxID=1903181 RepID=A0A1Q6DSK4_METT1|nr:MAG: ATPase of the AAA+ class CDC48 family [Candidatus Methanohalarchaeum thermophilum]